MNVGAGNGRTLLLGISGLDWTGLHDAVAAGWTPHLAALMARGGVGGLDAAGAPPGTAAWTMLATGQPPSVNGIARDLEYGGGGPRPVGRAAWRAAALWQTLTAAGIATGSVAWPGSGGGALARWPGLHVDTRFALASAKTWDHWLLPLHSVPDAHRDELRALRVHPTDITAAQMQPFVPAIATIDQDFDLGLTTLAVAMAQAATVQAAAIWALAQPDWRFLAVHHRFLGSARSVSHGAIPPYDQVAAGAWRFIDAMIGAIAAAAAPDTTLLIASPGWHDASGVLVAAGPGLPHGRIKTATLTDLAPTILARFGLADATLPGRILSQLAPSHGLRAVAPPPIAQPEADDHEELARIVALGYAPPPQWDVSAVARLRDPGLPPAEAIDIAQTVLAQRPADVEALSLMAFAHIALGQSDPLPAIAERLTRAAPAQPWGALVQGAYHAVRGEAEAARPWLVAAEKDADPITLIRIGGAWLLLDRFSDANRVFEAALALRPESAEAAVGLSITALARRDLRRAEDVVRAFLRRAPGHRPALLQLATVLDRAGRTSEAASVRFSAERGQVEA